MEISNPKTDTVKATMYTSLFKIEGYIHLMLNSYRGRLSDHLNNGPAVHFIPITDAKIFDRKTNEVLRDAKCIIINKSHIESIIEEQE